MIIRVIFHTHQLHLGGYYFVSRQTKTKRRQSPASNSAAESRPETTTTYSATSRCSTKNSHNQLTAAAPIAAGSGPNTRSRRLSEPADNLSANQCFSLASSSVFAATIYSRCDELAAAAASAVVDSAGAAARVSSRRGGGI